MLVKTARIYEGGKHARTRAERNGDWKYRLYRYTKKMLMIMKYTLQITLDKEIMVLVKCNRVLNVLQKSTEGDVCTVRLCPLHSPLCHCRPLFHSLTLALFESEQNFAVITWRCGMDNRQSTKTGNRWLCPWHKPANLLYVVPIIHVRRERKRRFSACA